MKHILPLLLLLLTATACRTHLETATTSSITEETLHAATTQVAVQRLDSVISHTSLAFDTLYISVPQVPDAPVTVKAIGGTMKRDATRSTATRESAQTQTAATHTATAVATAATVSDAKPPDPLAWLFWPLLALLLLLSGALAYRWLKARIS